MLDPTMAAFESEMLAQPRPRRAGTRRAEIDFSSSSGAALLARRLKGFWAAVGYDVQIEVILARLAREPGLRNQVRHDRGQAAAAGRSRWPRTVKTSKSNLGATEMKTLSLALAIVVAVYTNYSQRAKDNGLGYGNNLCNSWTKDAKTELLHYQHEAWLLGFLSGYNWHSMGNPSGDVIRDEDTSALVAWVDNYCYAHPLDHIVLAADQLIDELRRRNGRR